MPLHSLVVTLRQIIALAALCAIPAAADTLSFSGLITQSTESGTGPAVNNPDLNNVLLGDAFTVTIDFLGAINAPGTYPLAGASLLWLDSTTPTSESSFDSVSISVIADGAFYDISMLGCLTTGSGCLSSNQLDANFQILAAGLNSQNVAAQTIAGLSPAMDLLEDEGATDIQGSVTSYSYTPGSTSTVPEPSTIVPLTLAMLALGSFKRRTVR